ncbi:MAG: hypothetical protein JW969_13380 [Spirochaetales bacterium]|nr:hypothetical protein [Spirochaetales bacterium]
MNINFDNFALTVIVAVISLLIFNLVIIAIKLLITYNHQGKEPGIPQIPGFIYWLIYLGFCFLSITLLPQCFIAPGDLGRIYEFHMVYVLIFIILNTSITLLIRYLVDWPYPLAKKFKTNAVECQATFLTAAMIISTLIFFERISFDVESLKIINSHQSPDRVIDSTIAIAITWAVQSTVLLQVFQFIFYISWGALINSLGNLLNKSMGMLIGVFYFKVLAARHIYDRICTHNLGLGNLCLRLNSKSDIAGANLKYFVQFLISVEWSYFFGTIHGLNENERRSLCKKNLCIHCHALLPMHEVNHRLIVTFGKTKLRSNETRKVIRNPDVTGRTLRIDVSEMHIDRETADPELIEKFITFLINNEPVWGIKTVKAFIKGKVKKFPGSVKNLIHNNFSVIDEQ